MKIAQIMTPQVETVAPEAALQDAAGCMREIDVGVLPVCDGERLVGMLTDRDIILRALAEGRDPRTTRVRDVMTDAVRYAFDDQDVEDAVQMMNEHQIRRLPVLNRNKRLIGIVSLGDLAVRTDDEELSGQALEGVSEPNR